MILSIDTATERASVCLSDGGQVVAYAEHGEQREHAAFLHVAIEQMLVENGLLIEQVDAFAVTSGPGSYTGLRVAMATAKGFCYTLNKPLITVNTLQVMAFAAQQHVGNAGNYVFCPMIDARRMEVFTALYDERLVGIMQPRAVVLDGHFLNADNLSTAGNLTDKTIVFSGSGSLKFKASNFYTSKCVFCSVEQNAVHLSKVAAQHWEEKRFADVVYASPEYFKEFFSHC